MGGDPNEQRRYHTTDFPAHPRLVQRELFTGRPRSQEHLEDSGSGYTSPISQRNASSAFSTRGPASGSGRLIMITGIRSSRAATSFG